MKYSISEENHLKAIFHLQQTAGNVSTNELARELRTRPASVTDMMKKLKAKKLLHYQPYQGFRLTTEGNKVAIAVIRRHRLWEFFLAEKLSFSWNEVHDVAEELEHVRHPKLIEKLDEYLGFPRFDPHGDPIPDQDGKIVHRKQVCLKDLPLHQPARVSSVSNHSADMLEWLRLKKIGIDTKVEIKQRHPFDQSIELRIGRQAAITITEQMAQYIFVSYDPA